MFVNKQVTMLRPKEDQDEWFNLFTIHQNRCVYVYVVGRFKSEQKAVHLRVTTEKVTVLKMHVVLCTYRLLQIYYVALHDNAGFVW